MRKPPRDQRELLLKRTRRRCGQPDDPGPAPEGADQWKKALLEGASGVFEKGAAGKAPEVDEETVKELHAKIGELAVANDFLSRKLKPWGGM